MGAAYIVTQGMQDVLPIFKVTKVNDIHQTRNGYAFEVMASSNAHSFIYEYDSPDSKMAAEANCKACRSKVLDQISVYAGAADGSRKGYVISAYGDAIPVFAIDLVQRLDVQAPLPGFVVETAGQEVIFGCFSVEPPDKAESLRLAQECHANVLHELDAYCRRAAF